MIALLIALTIAVQAAAVPLPSTTAPTPAPAVVETLRDGSQRWSILTCPPQPKPGDIVVCGRKDDTVASGHGANRNLSAANALALQPTPCAARVGGCQVGSNVLGPPTMLVRIVGKLINPDGDCCESGEATDPIALVRDAAQGVRRAFAAKPDRSGRVAISLDDPAPVTGERAAAEAGTPAPLAH